MSAFSCSIGVKEWGALKRCIQCTITPDLAAPVLRRVGPTHTFACLFVSGVGWFERKRHLLVHPKVLIQDIHRGKGELHFRTSFGLFKRNCDKSIILGEEQTEMLPNGEEAKVIYF